MVSKFRERLFLWALAGLLVCMGTRSARADWINLSGAEVAPNVAEITVNDDHVRIALEAYISDLETFADLVPDEWLKDKTRSRPAPAERLNRFSEQGIQVVTDRGERLRAQLRLVEPRLRVDRRSPFAGMINPYTGRRIAEAPADKRVLYAELEYPFSGQPASLTFVPPRDAEGRPLVTIGFIAYHKAVPVIDFRYLGAPSRLALDWVDPWYSKFDHPNLKRHHKDAMMSFLYVEPFEVRHEILTRVKDLEHWIDLGLRGKRYIEVDELGPLKQRIGEYLLTKNPVRIDGQELKPILERSNYVRLSLSGIQLLQAPERLEISTAIVGVIITYLIDALPQEVTVAWELFTPQVQRVPTISIDPAGPLPTFVSPDDSVYRWRNFLKNYQPPNVVSTAVKGTLPALSVPVASLVCVLALVPVAWRARAQRKRRRTLRGPAIAAAVLVAAAGVLFPFAQVSVARPAATAPALEDAQAKRVLESLLKNIYRSFDFRAEADVYDKLATSVAGDLLAEVYLQSRRSLIIEQAGGAQARIKAVEVLDAKAQGPLDGRLAYDVLARWTAEGNVGHWGHVHLRKNLYEARLRIEARDGAWKLSSLQLVDEKRIDPAARQGANARRKPPRRPLASGPKK